MQKIWCAYEIGRQFSKILCKNATLQDLERNFRVRTRASLQLCGHRYCYDEISIEIQAGDQRCSQ